jgi:hypothetical protein
MTASSASFRLVDGRGGWEVPGETRLCSTVVVGVGEIDIGFRGAGTLGAEDSKMEKSAVARGPDAAIEGERVNTCVVGIAGGGWEAAAGEGDPKIEKSAFAQGSSCGESGTGGVATRAGCSAGVDESVTTGDAVSDTGRSSFPRSFCG